MNKIEDRYNEIKEWLIAYKNATSCKGVVLGLSGGKDSTVVAMLSKIVFGDNVLAILMPNGEQKDISDSLDIAKRIGVEYRIVNIETVYNSLINVIENKVVDTEKGRDWAENCKPITAKAKTNIPPRIRMTTLYAIAQTYGYRVVGTGNQSEGYVGWCTKFGDTACDLNPLAGFTCTEVKQIGSLAAAELGIDKDGFIESYINKAPSDGLTGKTDEDNLGFTYNLLDRYIRYGANGFEMDEIAAYQEQFQKIIDMHESSEHKRRMPYTIKDKFEV